MMEEYMREEMAYDRKNDLDYMAEVRDLQFDVPIPIEKLLRLHSEIQVHSKRMQRRKYKLTSR